VLESLAYAVGVLLDALHHFLATWGIFILLGLLIWLTFKFIRMVPNSKPQGVDPRSPAKVRWDDVAGVEEARAELEEVVEFLRDPTRFAAMGARVPKGIMLYGPPGTGKTLLAKAVAYESGATFFAVSASSFVEMYAGLGAARIRKLFEAARKQAPAIVFIDELDAVGAQRSGGGGNREQDTTLNQLLVELDGFDERERIVVMAASNRLDHLDSALLRPGRFDRRILVSAPDLAGREAILRVHTRGKPLADDVDLHDVARQTSGLTGADLANICNEAAIAAVRGGAGHVAADHLNGAVERVVAGLARRTLITDREKKVIAYHEAGHALVAWLVGEPSHRVTIVPRGPALGYTMHLPHEDRYLRTREELLDWLKVILAGRAAEQAVFGRVTTGAANDLEQAANIARSMVFEWGMGESAQAQTVRADNYALSEETKRLRDLEQRTITDGAYADALALVLRHGEALDALAAALLERETLDRAGVAALLDDVPRESYAAQDIGVELPREARELLHPEPVLRAAEPARAQARPARQRDR
jgi:cell division protease FtsH